MNNIFIIAHAPLASALRACALHVFPEMNQSVVALDVEHDVSPEATQTRAADLLAQLAKATGNDHALLLTDIFGATPCNVATMLIDDAHKLIAGVNLPMLLRALTYRHEALEKLVARASEGGVQGVRHVVVNALQNRMT